MSSRSALLSGPSLMWLQQTLESLPTTHRIFIISAIPLLYPQQQKVKSPYTESWDNYSAELKEQFTDIVSNAAKRQSSEVIILSGYVRVGFATSIGTEAPIYQFVSSGIRSSVSGAPKTRISSARRPDKASIFIRERNCLVFSVSKKGVYLRWLAENLSQKTPSLDIYRAQLLTSTPIGLSTLQEEVTLDDARTFFRTLRYPVRQRAFKRYLESIGNAFCLAFWEEVESFKLVDPTQPANASTLLPRATILYKTYLSTQASRSANISAATRDEIYEKIRSQDVSPTLFEGAQREALNALHQNFAAFLRSPFYVTNEDTTEASPEELQQLVALEESVKSASKSSLREEFKAVLLENVKVALQIAQDAPPLVRSTALYYCAKWLTLVTTNFGIPFQAQACAYFEEASSLSISNLHLLYAEWGNALSVLIDMAKTFALSDAECIALHEAAQAKLTAALALRPHYRIYSFRAADFFRCVRLFPSRATDFLWKAHDNYAQAMMLKPTSRKNLRAWGGVIESALANYNGERPWARAVAEAVEGYLLSLVVCVLKREATPEIARETVMPELATVHLMALSEHKWVAAKAMEALTRLSHCALASQVSDLLTGIDTARRSKKLQQTQQEKLWVLKSLPAELQDDLKAAKITEEEILGHWEPFLACLRCYARQLVELSGTVPSPIEPRPQQRALLVDYAAELRKILRPYAPEKDYADFMLVGRGGFGDVFKAVGKDGTPVAIKMLKKASSEYARQVYHEINFLQTSFHPSIVGFKAAYIHREHISIVMEYCDASDLRFFYEHATLDESEIAYFIYHICSALEYLHSRNRVHRDIKAENVLLNMNGGVKLADLGISTELQAGERLTQVAGSKYWIAPEMFTGTPYNTKVDIWSLGALLYELCHGEAPYEKVHPLRALLSTALHGAPHFEPGRSNELLDFASACFQRDPDQRPPAATLIQHSFLEIFPYQITTTAESIVAKMKVLFPS